MRGRGRWTGSSAGSTTERANLLARVGSRERRLVCPRPHEPHEHVGLSPDAGGGAAGFVRGVRRVRGPRRFGGGAILGLSGWRVPPPPPPPTGEEGGPVARSPGPISTCVVVEPVRRVRKGVAACVGPSVLTRARSSRRAGSSAGGTGSRVSAWSAMCSSLRSSKGKLARSVSRSRSRSAQSRRSGRSISSGSRSRASGRSASRATVPAGGLPQPQVQGDGEAAHWPSDVRP
jgi:hypothetical protein